MSGTISDAAPPQAANWDEWAQQGSSLPPAAPGAPVINNNPALDSGDAVTPLQRLLASQSAAQQAQTMALASNTQSPGGIPGSAPQGPPPAALSSPSPPPPPPALAPQAPPPAAPPPPPPALAPQAPPVLSAPLPAAPPSANSAPLTPGGPPVPRDATGLPLTPAGMAPVTPVAGAPVTAVPAAAAPAASAPVGSPKPTAIPPGSPEEVGLPAKGAYAPADITAALIKAGIPAAAAQTLTAVSGAESNYGAHQIGTRNPNGTTDFGIFQVNDGAHPALKPASLVGAPLDVQAKAAAAVYAQQGLGAWTTYNNGAYKGFLGNSQPASAGTSGSSSAPGGSGSSTDTAYTTNGQFDPAKALASIKGLQSPLPYPGAGAPSVGNQLLAFAGGMAGARSPGMALVGGFGAAGKEAQQQTGVQMQANQAVAGRNQAQAEMVLQAQAHAQMNQLMTGRLGVAQQNADAHTQSTTTATSYKEWQMSPEGQAAVATAKASGATESQQTVKDNFEQIKELDDAGMTANKQAIPAAQGVISQIDQAGAGPSVVSQYKRSIAMALGMPVGATDPAAIQLTNAYNSMNQSERAQSMKGLGLRTQNEFGVFIKGAGTIDNDPSVIKTLAGMQLQNAQADAQAYNDYHAMDPATRAALATQQSGISDFRAKYVQGVGAAQGVKVGPVGTGTAGAAPAATAPAATTPATTTPIVMHGPGGKTVRVDPTQTDSIAQLKAHGYQ